MEEVRRIVARTLVPYHDLLHSGPKQTALTIAAIAAAFYVFELLCLCIIKPAIKRAIKGDIKKADGVATQAIARVVGSLHNAIQVPIGLLILTDATINSSRIHGRNDLSQLMCLISAGYFLHDLVICLLRFDLEGPAYTIHALCCCMAYSYGAFSGFIHFHGAAFLMWETSTPFVHARWFLYKMGMDHHPIYIANGLMMVLAFFLARIVWGYYSSYLLVTDVIGERFKPTSTFPVGGTVAYVLAAVVMNTLNTWWFYKMAERAAQVVLGGKRAQDVGREKDD